MKNRDRPATFVFLAGIDNSGPGHWQRRFQARLPRQLWVEHAQWGAPRAAEWLGNLDAALAGLDGPKVAVAHSLGCLLLCAWAGAHPGASLDGALCVAPPDPDAPAFPRGLVEGFEPGYRTALGFPALVLASRNDPFGSLDYAARCARAWKAPLLDMGARGHLNAASGLDEWPEGWNALQAFLKEHGIR